MDRSRTLATPAPWISTHDTDAAAHARSPDEQVTVYYREHAEAVYRYLASVYGSAQDAEDVTQEAFLRLYEALVAQDPIDSPKAWVFTVARRLMLDRVKHARYVLGKGHASPHHLAELSDPAPDPEDVLSDRRRRVALRKAMRHLTAMEKQCLHARAEGLKLRQIGDLVGLDLRRVAEVIGRAIVSLQRHMRG